MRQLKGLSLLLIALLIIGMGSWRYAALSNELHRTEQEIDDCEDIAVLLASMLLNYGKEQYASAEVFSDELVQTFQSTAQFVEWARAR